MSRQNLNNDSNFRESDATMNKSAFEFNESDSNVTHSSMTESEHKSID